MRLERAMRVLMNMGALSAPFMHGRAERTFVMNMGALSAPFISMGAASAPFSHVDCRHIIAGALRLQS